MLAHQRSRCIEDMRWNAASVPGGYNDSIIALECWKYGNISHAERDVNFRLITLASDRRPKSPVKGIVEEKLERWLQAKEPYLPPQAPPNAGELQGGMRIVFCERPGAAAGMSMSRHAFEAVERTLMLHPATLPSLCVLGGAYSSFNEVNPENDCIQRVHIVSKFAHTVQIGNYLLSISYDTSRRWTNAFICGAGLTNDLESDNTYGNRLQQLTDAIVGSPELWTNLLFLPSCLLQNYTDRSTTHRVWTNRNIIELENKLGVEYRSTEGRRGGQPGIMRPGWPQEIDPKEITARLYAILPRNCTMNRCCAWLRNYAQFLLKLEERLHGDAAFRKESGNFTELRDTITYLISVLIGLDGDFTAMKDRASLQTSLLFSVISQQDSLLNRWIAGSTKRDSISMTTFTFITALFLPGTFIATLFSMTMFNWQPGNGNNFQASQGGDVDVSYVSDKFWLFWAFAAPLTLLTVAGWYLWFKYASSSWSKELRVGSTPSSFPVVDERDEEELLGPCTGNPFVRSNGVSTVKPH